MSTPNLSQIVYTSATTFVAVSAAIGYGVHSVKRWLGGFVDDRIVKSTEIVHLSESITKMTESVHMLSAQVASMEIHRHEDMHSHSNPGHVHDTRDKKEGTSWE